MTTDQYEKLPADEKEHLAECAKCGEIFDRRSLDEVLFHTEHKHQPDIQYSGPKSWIKALPPRNAWPNVSSELQRRRRRSASETLTVSDKASPPTPLEDN